jgi:hypothetical protein
MDDISAAAHGARWSAAERSRLYEGGRGSAPVGGSTLLTKMKIAFSGESFIRFRIT